MVISRFHDRSAVHQILQVLEPSQISRNQNFQMIIRFLQMLRVEELATIFFTLKLEVACYRQIRNLEQSLFSRISFQHTT